MAFNLDWDDAGPEAPAGFAVVTNPAQGPATEDEITEVVRQLAAARELWFGVSSVSRGLGCWNIVLEARRGPLTIRSAWAVVNVPRNVTKQQTYDGLLPFMDRIVGAFIDRVLGEIRRGESFEEKRARGDVQFRAVDTPTTTERAGRKIFDLS
jgi:hypothetical protein